MAKNLDKSKKGITQAEIIKAKKLNRQHLKNIDAFNKNTLLKTINVLVPYANKSVKQLNLKAKGNKFVQVLIKQRMDKEEINKLCNKLSKQFHEPSAAPLSAREVHAAGAPLPLGS